MRPARRRETLRVQGLTDAASPIYGDTGAGEGGEHERARGACDETLRRTAPIVRAG